jgi:hypothetical protein
VQAQQPAAEGYSSSQSPKNSTSRESKWFVKVYGSYGLPLASSFRPGNSIITLTAPNRFETKVNRRGLGQGVRAGGGIGYILNENINLGIDLEQNWFGTITSTNEIVNQSYKIERITPTRVDTTYNYTFQTQRVNARVLTITPNITFKAISRPDYYVYNRLGISFGVRNQLRQIRSDSTAASYLLYGRRTNVAKNAYRFEGGMSFGFLASLGVNFRVTSKTRFFTEAQFNHLTYTPRQRLLTHRFINGNDRLLEAGLTPLRERETRFVNKFQTNLEKIDVNKPAEETKVRIPVTSFGLSAGIAYRF